MIKRYTDLLIQKLHQAIYDDRTGAVADVNVLE